MYIWLQDPTYHSLSIYGTMYSLLCWRLLKYQLATLLEKRGAWSYVDVSSFPWGDRTSKDLVYLLGLFHGEFIFTHFTLSYWYHVNDVKISSLVEAKFLEPKNLYRNWTSPLNLACLGDAGYTISSPYMIWLWMLSFDSCIRKTKTNFINILITNYCPLLTSKIFKSNTNL